MSIKARIVVAISILIAIAFAVIGIVTVSVTEARMVERVDESLVTGQSSIPPAIRESFGQPWPEFGNRATAIIMLDSRGNMTRAIPSGFVTDPDPLPELDPERVFSNLNKPFTVDAAGGSDSRYRVLVRPLGTGGYLAQAAPLDDVDASVRALTAIIVVAGLVVLIAAVVSIWLTVRHELRPIDDMISTAGVIAGGDLTHRVQHQGGSTEVDALARALNDMLAQIEASFAAKEASESRLRQFVADASHELRTPLTSIRGYAELIRSGAAPDDEARERAVARIESEGARMGKLVEDLLLLARLDRGRPLARERVDLVQVVDEAVAAAQVIDPGRAISFDHPGAAYVLGDADRLRQVIDNLLSNARVHTPPGTAVTVTVDRDDSGIRLSVADNGPGIALHEPARVFDRFYRVDPSRTRASGGTGLGLSIVASIIEAHGGRITLDTAPGAGTKITITLPRVGPVQEEIAPYRQAVLTGR